MTPRKDRAELQRPRRYLGDALRLNLACPLCRKQDPLRIVAYRRKSARIECEGCKLRFSVDIMQFGLALVRKSDRVIDGDPMGWALVAGMTGLLDSPDKGQAAMEAIVTDQGMEAIEGHLRALGSWEAFLARVSDADSDA
jgi:hypothetical protein